MNKRAIDSSPCSPQRKQPGGSLADAFRFFLLLAVFILVAHSSCDEYLGEVDCAECWDIEPDSADLIVELTGDFQEGIPLVVYHGKIEEDSIEWIDTAYSSTYYLYVAVDRYYSVKAEYKKGDRRIVAVDGDWIRVKHVSEDNCGYECWIVTKGILDATLKFEDFE